MHNRASTLGASLTIGPRDDRRGTAVRLQVPLIDNEGARP